MKRLKTDKQVFLHATICNNGIFRNLVPFPNKVKEKFVRGPKCQGGERGLKGS
jgi:hypothetical protein